VASGADATAIAPLFTGGSIATVEKPVPVPGAGELLLRVQANAICGTDRKQYRDGSDVTPGHEAAGVVVAAGEGTRTPVGTLGVVFLMDFCGTCRSCALGYTNQCLAKRGDMGFDRDGGYGPYELVPETIFFPVDADISPSDATLLLDVMGTSRHALERAGRMRADIGSLLITGAGPIGLGVAAMAHLLLPDATIAITDVVPYRLALAERLGAIALRADESLPEALAAHGLTSVDIAIDGSGRRAAREAALQVLAKRGVLVCVGHGEDLRLDVSADLIATERTVMGSEYFRYDELPANLALLRDHRDYLRQVITHTFPVSEIAAAFELFLSGQSGKVVVEQ